MRKSPWGLKGLAAAAGIAAAAFFALPALADAATFYVDDSASSPLNPCTSPTPANACQTISAAVTQARLVPGPNTIMVAAGTYNESLNLNNAGDDGLTIDGAGSTASNITAPAGTAGIIMARPGLTVRDLSVNIPAANGQGVSVGQGAQTIDNVRVLMTGGDADDVAITVVSGAGSRTLRHLNVSDNGNAGWTGKVLSIAGATDPVTVTDSMLQGNGTVIESFAASTVIQRVSAFTTDTTLGRNVIQVVSPGPVGPGGSKDAAMTIDSSLVFGGQQGVTAQDAFGDAAHQSATATIRNTTIDPLLPGSGDGQVGVFAFDNVNNADARVTVDSSIVLAPQATFNSTTLGSSSVACTYSDLSNSQVTAGDASHGPISCGTASGNSGHNSTTTPSSSLFVTPFIFNWHLRDGSAAIDSGSPLPLAAGESATDLDGNPRVLNGDNSCPAVRDKGAYEHVTVGSDCVPPVATTTTPLATAPPVTTAPPKKKCKKKKQRRTAVSAKKCKKKKRH